MRARAHVRAATGLTAQQSTQQVFGGGWRDDRRVGGALFEQFLGTREEVAVDDRLMLPVVDLAGSILAGWARDIGR